MELVSIRDYPSLTTFIVGHEYVTCLTYYNTNVSDLIDEVIAFVGDDKPHKPFVCISCSRLSDDNFQDLREKEEIYDILVGF